MSRPARETAGEKAPGSSHKYPDWMEQYPPEFWLDEEVRRWVNMWNRYAECQKLKRAMRED